MGLQAATGANSLQTRTTLFGAFYSSERLRVLMGPISGGIGILGDGVPEGIAGDKKIHPGRYNGQFFTKPFFAVLGTPNGSVATSACLEP